jgi:hypothetical protein
MGIFPYQFGAIITILLNGLKMRLSCSKEKTRLARQVAAYALITDRQPAV